MRKQALTKMCEIAVGIAGRGNAFVNLKYVDLAPGDSFIGEIPKHDPRRLTTADRHHEFATLRNRLTGIFCDNCRGAAGYCRSVLEHFHLHDGRLQQKNGLGFRLPGELFLDRGGGIVPTAWWCE